jgi:hypothetical protein
MLSRVRSSKTTTGAEASKRDTQRVSHLDVPAATSLQAELNSYTIQRRKRFWEVRAPSGELICLTVYKRGAKEVIRRLCA